MSTQNNNQVTSEGNKITSLTMSSTANHNHNSPSSHLSAAASPSKTATKKSQKEEYSFLRSDSTTQELVEPASNTLIWIAAACPGLDELCVELGLLKRSFSGTPSLGLAFLTKFVLSMTTTAPSSSVLSSLQKEKQKHEKNSSPRHHHHHEQKNHQNIDDDDGNDHANFEASPRHHRTTTRTPFASSSFPADSNPSSPVFPNSNNNNNNHNSSSNDNTSSPTLNNNNQQQNTYTPGNLLSNIFCVVTDSIEAIHHFAKNYLIYLEFDVSWIAVKNQSNYKKIEELIRSDPSVEYRLFRIADVRVSKKNNYCLSSNNNNNNSTLLESVRMCYQQELMRVGELRNQSSSNNFIGNNNQQHHYESSSGKTTFPKNGGHNNNNDDDGRNFVFPSEVVSSSKQENNSDKKIIPGALSVNAILEPDNSENNNNSNNAEIQQNEPGKPTTIVNENIDTNKISDNTTSQTTTNVKPTSPQPAAMLPPSGLSSQLVQISFKSNSQHGTIWSGICPTTRQRYVARHYTTATSGNNTTTTTNINKNNNNSISAIDDASISNPHQERMDAISALHRLSSMSSVFSQHVFAPVFVSRQEHYFIVEAYEFTLDSIFREGNPRPCSYAFALRIFFTMVMALKGFHEVGCVARSIGPMSVGIDNHQRMRVSISSCVLQSKSKDRFESLFKHFASPEGLLQKEFSPAGDVWCVGCSMMKLLTGRRLFDEVKTDELPEFFKKKMNEEKSIESALFYCPNAVRESNEQWLKDVPAQFLNLIERMLSLDPAKRPTIAEIETLPFFPNTPEKFQKLPPLNIIDGCFSMKPVDKTGWRFKFVKEKIEKSQLQRSNENDKHKFSVESVIAIVNPVLWSIHEETKIKLAELKRRREEKLNLIASQKKNVNTNNNNATQTNSLKRKNTTITGAPTSLFPSRLSTTNSFVPTTNNHNAESDQKNINNSNTNNFSLTASTNQSQLLAESAVQDKIALVLQNSATFGDFSPSMLVSSESRGLILGESENNIFNNNNILTTTTITSSTKIIKPVPTIEELSLSMTVNNENNQTKNEESSSGDASSSNNNNNNNHNISNNDTRDTSASVYLSAESQQLQQQEQAHAASSISVTNHSYSSSNLDAKMPNESLSNNNNNNQTFATPTTSSSLAGFPKVEVTETNSQNQNEHNRNGDSSHDGSRKFATSNNTNNNEISSRDRTQTATPFSDLPKSFQEYIQQQKEFYATQTLPCDEVSFFGLKQPQFFPDGYFSDYEDEEMARHEQNRTIKHRDSILRYGLLPSGYEEQMILADAMNKNKINKHEENRNEENDLEGALNLTVTSVNRNNDDDGDNDRESSSSPESALLRRKHQLHHAPQNENKTLQLQQQHHPHKSATPHLASDILPIHSDDNSFGSIGKNAQGIHLYRWAYEAAASANDDDNNHNNSSDDHHFHKSKASSLHHHHRPTSSSNRRKDKKSQQHHHHSLKDGDIVEILVFEVALGRCKEWNSETHVFADRYYSEYDSFRSSDEIFLLGDPDNASKDDYENDIVADEKKEQRIAVSATPSVQDLNGTGSGFGDGTASTPLPHSSSSSIQRTRSLSVNNNKPHHKTSPLNQLTGAQLLNSSFTSHSTSYHRRHNHAVMAYPAFLVRLRVSSHDLYNPNQKPKFYITEEILGRGGFATVKLGIMLPPGKPVACKIFESTSSSSLPPFNAEKNEREDQNKNVNEKKSRKKNNYQLQQQQSENGVAKNLSSDGDANINNNNNNNSRHDFLRFCQHEFEVMKNFTNYRNVAQVIDFKISSNGKPILFMELLAVTLQKLLDQFGAFEALMAVTYFKQAASGLHALALEGFAHSDVKLGNMMLTSDGALKITDFGLTFREGSALTGCSSFYLAPELTIVNFSNEEKEEYARLMYDLEVFNDEEENNENNNNNAEPIVKYRLNSSSSPSSNLFDEAAAFLRNSTNNSLTSIANNSSFILPDSQFLVRQASAIATGQSSQAADCYSLGVSLWKMLTGLPTPDIFQRPRVMNFDFIMSRRQWIKDNMPEIPREFPGISEILEKCLHLNPDRRPLFSDIVDNFNPRIASAAFRDEMKMPATSMNNNSNQNNNNNIVTSNSSFFAQPAQSSASFSVLQNQQSIRQPQQQEQQQKQLSLQVDDLQNDYENNNANEGMMLANFVNSNSGNNSHPSGVFSTGPSATPSPAAYLSRRNTSTNNNNNIQNNFVPAATFTTITNSNNQLNISTASNNQNTFVKNSSLTRNLSSYPNGDVNNKLGNAVEHPSDAVFTRNESNFSQPNFFGVDLNNNPKGNSTSGEFDPANLHEQQPQTQTQTRQENKSMNLEQNTNLHRHSPQYNLFSNRKNQHQQRKKTESNNDHHHHHHHNHHSARKSSINENNSDEHRLTTTNSNVSFRQEKSLDRHEKDDEDGGNDDDVGDEYAEEEQLPQETQDYANASFRRHNKNHDDDLSDESGDDDDFDDHHVGDDDDDEEDDIVFANPKTLTGSAVPSMASSKRINSSSANHQNNNYAGDKSHRPYGASSPFGVPRPGGEASTKMNVEEEAGNNDNPPSPKRQKSVYSTRFNAGTFQDPSYGQ